MFLSIFYIKKLDRKMVMNKTVSFEKRLLHFWEKRKENITCALFWKITFMTVDDSTVFVQKPHTALWLDGKFLGFEKIDFSPVYDVTSNFGFKCYYYMENVVNAHAYLN
jgi:hypothetical protein